MLFIYPWPWAPVPDRRGRLWRAQCERVALLHALLARHHPLREPQQRFHAAGLAVAPVGPPSDLGEVLCHQSQDARARGKVEGILEVLSTTKSCSGRHSLCSCSSCTRSPPVPALADSEATRTRPVRTSTSCRTRWITRSAPPGHATPNCTLLGVSPRKKAAALPFTIEHRHLAAMRHTICSAAFFFFSPRRLQNRFVLQ
jgi:hypothetical protein